MLERSWVVLAHCIVVLVGCVLREKDLTTNDLLLLLVVLTDHILGVLEYIRPTVVGLRHEFARSRLHAAVGWVCILWSGYTLIVVYLTLLELPPVLSIRARPYLAVLCTCAGCLCHVHTLALSSVPGWPNRGHLGTIVHHLGLVCVDQVLVPSYWLWLGLCDLDALVRPFLQAYFLMLSLWLLLLLVQGHHYLLIDLVNRRLYLSLWKATPATRCLSLIHVCMHVTGVVWHLRRDEALILLQSGARCSYRASFVLILSHCEMFCVCCVGLSWVCMRFYATLI